MLLRAAADGDGRDPAQARDPDTPCDRLGCVATLPEGESLSLVIDRLAFDEDCERAEIVVSALTAPADCGAKFVLDEKALAKLGAVGLIWSDDKGFALTADRTTEQNRPWSPAPAHALDDRVVRPGRRRRMGPSRATGMRNPLRNIRREALIARRTVS